VLGVRRAGDGLEPHHLVLDLGRREGEQGLAEGAALERERLARGDRDPERLS